MKEDKENNKTNKKILDKYGEVSREILKVAREYKIKINDGKDRDDNER